MRILPGHPKEFANETPTSHHLMRYAVSNPEILPQVATLFKSEHTAFSSLLAERGLTSGNLYNDMNPRSKSYKTVGNTKVMWPVKGMKTRLGTFTTDAVCNISAYSTTPGKYQSVIAIYVDTNWFAPYDILELEDNRTQVHVVDDILPEETSPGTWRYYVKLVTNDETDFIDTSLLESGKQIGWVQTAFYEMSETAYEKYTFHEMATSYMTLQRMKWSISGTAEQMKTNTTWVEHNGVKMWTEYADMQMLERWAMAREYQLIFGKGTVTSNETVLLKDLKNREILAGDGIMNQGDGALRFQYNQMTINTIENVMDNMALYSNNDGIIEIGVIGGRKFLNNFMKVMANYVGTSLEHVVEGTGRNKGINATYSFYEFNGVRIVPRWYKWFDSPERPKRYAADGSRIESNRGLFVSLGNVDAGEPMIELLALGNRQFLRGEVNGINKGGEMANSVDGRHVHILCQTGIANKDVNGVAEMYMPYA